MISVRLFLLLLRLQSVALFLTKFVLAGPEFTVFFSLPPAWVSWWGHFCRTLVRAKGSGRQGWSPGSGGRGEDDSPHWPQGWALGLAAEDQHQPWGWERRGHTLQMSMGLRLPMGDQGQDPTSLPYPST